MENIDALKRAGYLIIDKFFTNQQCQEIISSIATYQEKHDVPEVYRLGKERSLRYSVIDGEKIAQHFPKVWSLYEKVNQLVNQVSGENLMPLSNKMPAVNINIIKPNGEYRWHYDRNAVTALLYLNAVEGGQIEMYPRYRITLKNKKYSFCQKYLDDILQFNLVRQVFGNKVSIQPRRGLMLIMQGNNCLHSVKAVEGENERINIVMAYDFPEAEFPVEQDLDSYLYTNQQQVSSDPNYLQ